MKSFAGFVTTDRRAWHRDKLLAMLGDEALVQRVEQAENDYLHFAPQLAQGRESDKDAQNDLRELAGALATLHRLYTPGGSAKAIFEGVAIQYVGADVLQRLRDTVSQLPGELMAQAATVAHEQFHPRRHRPDDPLKAERLRLVDVLAGIAHNAGIEVERNDRDGALSEFGQLLAYIYDRLHIVSPKNPDKAMNPDNDIRVWIEENRTSP